jgi:type IV secretory pathway VirB3-like protein
MALPVLFHECSIAANIIGVPSAILVFVLSPGSIVFLLLLVNTPKVIPMVRAPLFVGLTFPLSAAFLAAAGYLSSFAARIRNE